MSPEYPILGPPTSLKVPEVSPEHPPRNLKRKSLVPDSKLEFTILHTDGIQTSVYNTQVSAENSFAHTVLYDQSWRF